MRALFVALICLMAVNAVAGTYRWVDAQGVVHYSDRPHPGAKEVALPTAQTYKAPPTSSNATSSARKSTSAPPPRACAITSPRNDETLVNVPSMTATLSVTPEPAPSESVTMSLDGTTLPGKGVSNSVSPIARGTHTLTAKLQDADGRVICQSSVTFHVRQPSVQAPNRKR